MVTRAEVGIRQRTLWLPGTVPYSMTAVRNGYRTDCSGYVSGTLAIPGPGLSTINLPDLCTVIDPSTLQLGDLIGHMGPDTGGAAGHVMSFEAFSPTGLIIWEQAGGTMGQRRRTIKQVPVGYLCYQPIMFTKENTDVPKLLRVNQTGLILITNGPTWYHLGTPDLVEAAMRIWGLPGPEPLDEWHLPACGVQVPFPGGPGGLPDHTHTPGGVA
jgi:hypothetical protein